MFWDDSFIAFDTETTGLGGNARILEIAVVHFYRGKRLYEWSTYLNPPDVAWDDPKVREALAVNKIRREDLEGAPQFKDVVTDLYRELGSGIWVAHNATFDLRMLDQEFTAAGVERPHAASLIVCTKALSARLDPELKGHSLHDVSTRHGLLNSQQHRAVADADTAGRVLLAMAPRLPRRAKALKEWLERS